MCEYVCYGASAARRCWRAHGGYSARLTQVRRRAAGWRETDLREGALGEDAADKSLAAKESVAGPQAAMGQAALT
jgi:hypothetical protein